MKYKTADLEGARLDAAVALAEGYSDLRLIESRGVQFSYWAIDSRTRVARYGTEWQFGGPIIEKERIAISKIALGGEAHTPQWTAHMIEPVKDSRRPNVWEGQTPLIAGMRAYVASKLGEEVELP